MLVLLVARGLYPEELLPDIERAFDEDLVDTLFVGRNSVERTMSEGQAQALRRCDGTGPIEDTVSEIGGWSCFRTRDRAARERASTIVRNTLRRRQVQTHEQS